jgi:hypothetical protein
MRGLLHAHSDFSYDGQASLQELASWGSQRGLDCILLSEHANDFTPEKMRRYVAEVEGLAHDGCRLVPGLEFAVRGGFHIIGFNIRHWEHRVEPLDVVRLIREQGGLAVLAHPARYAGRWPDDATLAQLQGIEVWNARYDGRFLPSGDVLDAATAITRRFDKLQFFGGQDIHLTSPNRLVVTDVAAARGIEEFLQGLADGVSTFGAGGLRFPARPRARPLSLALLKCGHLSYTLARRLRDRIAG